MKCFCGCGERPTALHHIVYRQTLRWARGDPDDERNLVPVALACHHRHHSAMVRYRVSDLPDEAFVFAHELLGAGAYDWLRRRYRGEDPRLEALLPGGET